MTGFYQMERSKLLVRDPELIKTIFSSDFRNFQDIDLRIESQQNFLLTMHPFFASNDT